MSHKNFPFTSQTNTSDSFPGVCGLLTIDFFWACPSLRHGYGHLRSSGRVLCFYSSQVFARAQKSFAGFFKKGYGYHQTFPTSSHIFGSPTKTCCGVIASPPHANSQLVPSIKFQVSSINAATRNGSFPPSGEIESKALQRELPYPFFKKLIFLLLFFASFQAFSQDRKKLEKEREKLQKEIAFTQKLLKETAESRQSSLSQLETLRQQIELREKVIRNLSKEMQAISEHIDETGAIILALEKDLENLKTEYAGMLYSIYKNRSALNQLIFIFNAKSFNDAFARVRYLQRFGEFRKRQAEMIKQTKLTLERKKREQEGRKKSQQQLLDAERGQKTKLSEELNEKDKLVASLQQQEKKLKDDIEAKRKAAENLNKKIEEIILRAIKEAEAKAKAEAAKKKAAESAKASTKTSALALTPEAAKLSADFASNQGRLPWPVEKGIISERFGEHPHPVLKNVKIVNNGIDIKTNENAQVRSLFQGTVVTVMYNPGFQRAVMVRHGEYFTVYSNLKEVFVRSGDEIATKQPLGIVHSDDDGSSKVHIELWKGTQKLNPALWIYQTNQ